MSSTARSHATGRPSANPRPTYYGEVRRRDDHSGFALTRLHHERGRRMPEHGHQHAYFCLVVRGGYAERYGRTEITYPQRAVLFHPAGIVHRDAIAPGGASFLIVEIGEALERRAEAHARLDTSVQDLRGGELARAAHRLEREARGPAPRPLVIEGLVLEMIGIVGAAGRSDRRGEPAWLGQVIDRLHEEIGRRHTLEALAREAGVHPVTLARGFRRALGVGVGEYLNELRVRWVEERLGEPDGGLADLAIAAGFADQSHMTRAFRRVTGRTPGAVRRGLR
jgi:AraC family transcriptional regulator